MKLSARVDALQKQLIEAELIHDEARVTIAERKLKQALRALERNHESGPSQGSFHTASLDTLRSIRLRYEP